MSATVIVSINPIQKLHKIRNLHCLYHILYMHFCQYSAKIQYLSPVCFKKKSCYITAKRKAAAAYSKLNQFLVECCTFAFLILLLNFVHFILKHFRVFVVVLRLLNVKTSRDLNE